MYLRPGTIFITILLACFISGLTGEIKKSPADIFPENIMEWKMKGQPEVYKGDDLFLYINGGADIYQEYGFKEVSSVEYEKNGSGRISVEIYRMDDPAAAFGMFSFKTGGKWKESRNGNLYFPEDYYQNILAGDCLITITSIDINVETEKSARIFREIFEKNISGNSPIPRIVNLFNQEKFEKRLYFEGDLGLMNTYNLVSTESGITNGAAGIKNNSITLLLHYNEGKDIKSAFSTLVNLLKSESRYSKFRLVDGGVSFIDRKKNVVYVTILDRYIVIYIGEKLDEGKIIVKQISDELPLIK
ncbi:MAG: hypothetical protein KAS21_04315 [Candidatus Aminicenantes bacterium]|nr:hypothetical protein [Candidatus Aminicenantes bacterium]